MTSFDMGTALTRRQAQRQPARWKPRALLVGAGLVAASLAGCSAQRMVHNIEGGEVAKPRPAPPGLNEPYPNLATVPARPAPPDQKELASISQSLVADRENARHLTVPAPPDPSLPSASPGLFGVGTVPPPPPPGSASATLAAVEGPPAVPSPATPKPIPSAALPTQPTAPVPFGQAAQETAEPSVNPVSPPPTVPAGPPAPPRIASLGPPAGAPPAVAATPPPPPSGGIATAQRQIAHPPIPAPSLPVDPATTVAVPFEPASAVLPAPSAAALKTLAARRGAATISVSGYGDARSSDPGVQSEAVALGLQRAEAIAQSLAADGVPESAVRIDAHASGRGGTAMLIQ